ncbi:hypothetical protein [Actinoplanes regularis]|uniref:DUF5709 domain-containing protein n=1 Tax=Actinoplanes regularis TaxID=52697 RepID=A0A238XVP2_9ACTN|nr:hypothetical protein [Actinoplanes regularis]GIE87754.1 hypothetical protein Are01nite_42340 [Actinoplanes regularis]GLW28110.1 hypothetical protein Areg01_10500 [Actinoplanes regularis]SNR62628.1 hypothetical protein SAMN06264365_10432 [Actinoplanes regularis]
MTDVHDEPADRLSQPGDEISPAGDQSGPEYDPGGDLAYDEAHGAGAHLDVPAALAEEAERRRAMAPPRSA